MAKSYERIFCANRSHKYAKIAVEFGWKLGNRLPTSNPYKDIYFADQDFKKPENMPKYVESVKACSPTIATSLDLEHPSQLDLVMKYSEEISKYVETVIIIPKYTGIIASLPETINEKEIRLGYSVPSRYGKTDVPFFEFGTRPVHLLGGSLHAHLVLSDIMNVVSADANSLMRLSSMGLVWTPFPVIEAFNKYAPSLTNLGLSHVRENINTTAFRMSLENYEYAYNSELYGVPPRLLKTLLKHRRS